MNVLQDKVQVKKSLNAILEQLSSVSYDPEQPGKAYQQLENKIKSLGNVLSLDPEHHFSKAETLRVMEEHQLDPGYREGLKNILDQCEEARFSFHASETHFKGLAEETAALIRKHHA